MQRVHEGYNLIVDRFVEKEDEIFRISTGEKFRVSTFVDGHYFDEITLTKDQYAELKDFVREDIDGIIHKPFYDTEIDKEFQPRFGGANPKYKDFYYAGWHAAFDYVNETLYKRGK